jgi:hypothetical protein
MIKGNLYLQKASIETRYQIIRRLKPYFDELAQVYGISE